jgi:hypothetical protein
MKMTALREGGPGSPFSIRRILASFFALAAVALFAQAQPVSSWTGALPGGLCLAACVILLFFTTWADVAAVVRAARGALGDGMAQRGTE